MNYVDAVLVKNVQFYMVYGDFCDGLSTGFSLSFAYAAWGGGVYT